MGRDEDAAEDAAAAKARLRAELLAARRDRSAGALDRARGQLRRHVLDRLVGVRRAAGYLPMRTEPGSTELLAGLHTRGISVIVPVMLPSRDLDWAEWAPSGLGPPLGVDAIASADLVLAPALALAQDGTRLGRGGGSYDRALARCAARSLLVGLVFDDELVDLLPHDEWDVPVQAAVTPSGWIELGNTEMRPRR